MVLRARSGFGVCDGVSVRVAVGVMVEICVGVAVLVTVLDAVNVALGTGVAVNVEFFVGVATFVAVVVSVSVALGCSVFVGVSCTVADAVAGFFVAVRVCVRDFVGLLVGVPDFVRVLVTVLVRVATRAIVPAFPATCCTTDQCMQAINIDRITIPVRREDVVLIVPLFHNTKRLYHQSRNIII